MKRLILLFLILSPGILISQSSKDISLSWMPVQHETIAEGVSKAYLSFSGAIHTPEHNYLPLFHFSTSMPGSGKILVSITNVQWEDFNPGENIDGLDSISGQIEIESGIGSAAGHYLGDIEFIPIRKNITRGQFERITHFTLNWTYQQSVAKQRSHRSSQYASNSVLSSGDWFEFSTDKEGIYKLDYDFLQNKLNMNLKGIDPKNIMIYGNGGYMLAEFLGDPKPDDLIENAILVQGEADGSFDQSDYILFYGTGTDRSIQKDAIVNGDTILLYKHDKNLYDTVSHYFITVSNSPGLRIQSQNSSGVANYISNQSDYHIWLEQDKHNLAESGREWYGQLYDNFYPSQTEIFQIPDIVTDSLVYIKMNYAARNLSGYSNFTTKVNGQTLFSNQFSSVGPNYYDTYARAQSHWGSFTTNGTQIQVGLQFNPGSGGIQAQGWLNYIDLIGRRWLKLSGDQITFRDHWSAKPGRVTNFQVTATGSNISVWETTDPLHPKRQSLTVNGSLHQFTLPTDSLRSFITFNGNSYFLPVAIGKVANQNIHGSIGQPDMLIVTHPDFYNQAVELAQFHESYNNLKTEVVMLPQVYNEFSSGNQDVSAIRNLMKMLYDRAAGNSTDIPQYLLLFGDGSYDYKNIEFDASSNTNFIPTYQSYQSLDRSTTFTSDDYFGMLDDNEGMNIVNGVQKLDLAIGRLPVDNKAEADAVVAKIKNYVSQVAQGNWRNKVTFVADDEDGTLHVNDANKIANQLETDYPYLNIEKIYLDAYQQVSTPGGGRYPDVNAAINSTMYSGTLIMNYTGHGGEDGWALERILTNSDVESWVNFDRLPIFVTATCSFSRYDNPNKNTTGEKVLINATGGVVGLVTTVRLVYSYSNYILDSGFFSNVFEEQNGTWPTLGQVLSATKNDITGNANNRKFTLLGDPALPLAYPTYSVTTSTIDTKPFEGINDTIRALQKVTITGEIRDESGTNLMSNFNGTAYITIYDKEHQVHTLQNDPDSNPYTFSQRNNIVYKGKASVSNGLFTYTFVVPKDISYNYGTGKISYYAADGSRDAKGYDWITIGGTSPTAPDDNNGPDVNLFMNDDAFIFGGTTDPNPVLLVKLKDENGINTTGNIGHDISGILDEENQNKIVLNEFYEAGLDDYTRGSLKYPLNNLRVGKHTLKVVAWDVYNNSGEGNIEFFVADNAEMALSHVLNYPNPFTTSTTFWFDHNKPGQVLDVQIDIYTVAGKRIKTIRQQIITEGYHEDEISWDGLDDYGNQIGKGAYVYKLSVGIPGGKRAHVFEKLVVLR